MKQINKKGFTAQNFIVALIIFTGVLSLFVLMIGSAANDYDNTNIIDEQFSEQFDKFDETTELAGDIYSSFNQSGGSLIGTTELYFTAGFSVVSLIFTSVTTASGILLTFPTYFGFDTTASIIMMTIIFSILGVLIVFTIINSLRGNKL